MADFPLAGRLRCRSPHNFLLAAVTRIGASGAVLATSYNEFGTVVRDSAGQYTLTLDQPVVHATIGVTLQSAGTAVDIVPQIKSFTNGKTITVQCLTGTTPTDPPNGAALNWMLNCLNSISA